MAKQKRRQKYLQKGFTIIEIMIFIVVSVALLGVTVTAITAQSNRTAFAQTVREFELQIQDVLNDAETGYYASHGDAQCEPFSPAQPRGKNAECIFLGKAVEIHVDSVDSRYQVHTVSGDAGDLGNLPQGNVSNAFPRVNNQLEERYDLAYGVEIKKIVYGSNPTDELLGFAVLSTLGRPLNDSGSIGIGEVAGSLQFAIYKVEGPGDFSSTISALEDGQQARETITICLQESGGGRLAQVQLGINNQRLGTTSTIGEWDTVCE